MRWRAVKWAPMEERLIICLVGRKGEEEGGSG